MKLQKLYSYTRQAVQAYHMIEENDKIAIGISGGKDSLTLLYALAGIKKFYPIPFDIIAVTVDLGYSGFDLTEIQRLCSDLDVPYHIVSTQISEIIMNRNASKSSCVLCAKMRKGALNSTISTLGCNKVAYAHHMDDIIETMLLSLIFEGRFYSFAPITHFEDTNLSVIRPLMYVPEADIYGFQHKYHLPVAPNPCPYDGQTKREYAKTLLRHIEKENPGVRKRLFHAIENGNIDDWTLIK